MFLKLLLFCIKLMNSNKIILVSYALTNTITTLIMKLQGNSLVQEAGQEINFYHPFMMTWVMILGEALCFIPFYFGKKIQSTKQSGKLPAKISICFLPLFLDLLASNLVFVGLNYVSASVYSIMDCSNVVFTAMFSRIILKSTFQRAQILGSILVIIAAIISGFGQFLEDKPSDQFDLMIIGIILIAISIVVHGLCYTILEKTFNQYDVKALQMVGWQGIVGTILWSILMIILSFVGCPFSEQHCVRDNSGNLHLDHFEMFFISQGSNIFLLVITIIFLFGVARYNYDYSIVIIKINALTVCILNIFSNSLIWIIGIIVTLIAGDDEQFKLQSLDLLVNGLKFTALIISSIGLLIYQKLIFKKFLIKYSQNSSLMGSKSNMIGYIESQDS